MKPQRKTLAAGAVLFWLGFSPVPASGQSAVPAQVMNVAGLYEVKQIDFPTSCTPTQLPASSPGAQGEAADFGFVHPSYRMQITQQGPRLTMTLFDENGKPVLPLTIHGVLQSDGTFRGVRIQNQSEPRPRNGMKEIFHSREQLVATPRFVGSGAKLGFGGDLDWALEFRQGSATGPVFTTCLYKSTIAATRKQD